MRQRIGFTSASSHATSPANIAIPISAETASRWKRFIGATRYAGVAA